MALFVYGTLRHPPLLECVLGRNADAVGEPATLPDHAVHWADGQIFPMITQAPGAVAEGLLLDGLSAQDIDRLDFYEGGFGYTLRPVTVQTAKGSVAAQVYFPDPGLWAPAAPWSLQDWVSRDGELSLLAAQEVMERMGTASAQEVARLFPHIRARAWARMLGGQGAPAELRRNAAPKDVEVAPRDDGYDGFFRLKSFDLRHRRFNGNTSDWFARETFVAYDAALVLPYDPRRDCVMLVEQLRYGPIWRGDPNPWVLEPIAGLVDAGEAPEDTARREAVEEAGLALGALELISRGYSSPGYSSEFFHCYLGLCDLSAAPVQTAGLADENEDIRSHILPFEQALAMIDSGEVNAGPLALMLLWLARHRTRLRASA